MQDDFSWKPCQLDVLPDTLESTSNDLNYDLKRLRVLKYMYSLFKALEGKYKALGNKTLTLG